MPEAAVATPPAAAPAAAAAPVSGGFNAAMDALTPAEVTAPETGAGASAPGGPPDLGTPGGEPATPPEIVTTDDQQVIPEDHEEELAAAVAEPDAVADPYEMELKPDSVSKDGRRMFFNKNKGERLMEAHKTLQQIREIDPGFSVENYQEMAARTLELDRMLTDFASGDPSKVALIASDFVGAGQNPASVNAFADNVMASVAQHHPAAYQLVQSKVLSALAQQHLNRFKQSGDVSAKALAQNLDWLAKGAKANPVAGVDFMDPDAAPGAQQNPVAAQLAEIQRQTNEYNLRVNTDRRNQIQQAVQGAESAGKAAVTQAIESALNVIPANVRSAKALEYKHAVRDLQDKFAEVSEKSPLYSKQYQTALAAVQANPTDQAKAKLVAVVKQYADWVIGQEKRAVLGRFNSTVMEQNRTVHQKQEEMSRRVEPGAGNNNPVQRATLSQKLREGKVSVGDYFDNLR